MKKILLTAVIAMLGMSAWAAKPEAGTKGYLYNAAAGKFIGADAKLSDTGQEFEIYFKSADSKNPNEEFPDRGFGENSFFVRFKTGSNYLAISSQPVAISANYSQMVVKETENGWLISHAYVLNDGNAPDWVKNNTDEYQGAYLQVVDGELVFSKDETNKAAYWKFVDQDEYDKLTATLEPTPEPTPAVFPEFGAQGFLYNPESGLIVNASATLVSKAEINKETDILTVWQKGTESYSATRVRIATGKTDDVWTSLRVKDGEEGAYTIGFINDGYSRMTLEAGPEEGSYYINNTYNTDGESTHPGYIKANVEDGSLTIATEKDEYCVWKFLTEEEFDALATRISSVEKQPATQAIFNVAGQQLKNLQKGLNIVNGKKIMVK